MADNLELFGEAWPTPAAFLAESNEDGVRDMALVRSCPDVHGHFRCPCLSTVVVYQKSRMTTTLYLCS